MIAGSCLRAAADAVLIFDTEATDRRDGANDVLLCRVSVNKCEYPRTSAWRSSATTAYKGEKSGKTYRPLNRKSKSED